MLLQAQMGREAAERRQKQLAAAGARRSAAASLLQRAWLRVRHAVSDHSRSALILALFGFKLLEWWVRRWRSAGPCCAASGVRTL